MRVLDRLMLWQKLSVLIAAMLVPTALLAVFYLSETNGVVQEARSELDGARYLQAVGSTLALIASHRSRSHAFLTGDTSRKDDMYAAESEIDQQLAVVDALDAEYGERFKSTTQWQAIKSTWSDLKANLAKSTPDDNLKRHDALFDQIDALVTTVSMNSGLSLDPDAKTTTLIVAATERVGNALTAMSKLNEHAIGAAVKGYLGGDDRIAIHIYGAQVTANLNALSGELQWASNDARASVAPALAAVSHEFATFSDTINTRIVNAQKMDIPASQVFDAAVPAVRALQNLSTVSYVSMKTALDKRASTAAVTRDVTAAIVAGVLALSLAMSWLIAQALSRPMARAVRVFDAIAAGHYDNLIETAGTDEVGQVLRALEDMQTKLRHQIEAERAQAAENARIRQALDKVSTNVVLADASHKIIYLNETAEATFARTQAELRKSLPSFEAARLRGSSLDVVSVDPAQQRRMLETLSGSSVQDRALGGLSFRTVSNPVVSRDGARIGTVMEWTDRTPEVAVEQEMQAMLTAVLGGNLTERISLGAKAGFFEALARNVNQLADNMAEIVAKVKHAAGEVYRGAEEISQGNGNLSQRTEEQSSSLEETASSMEEMTSTVKQNADNAGQANQLAIAARDQAEKGGAVVAKAVARHDRHQRRLEEDRRHHRRDRRDRLPDQSPRAQCRGRGGARRRAGTRLRGRGERGPQSRRPLGDGREGDQGADPGLREEGGRRLGARDPVGPDPRADRRRGEEGVRHRRRDRCGLARAVLGDRAGQPRRDADGRAHAAERRPGRAGDGRLPGDGPAGRRAQRDDGPLYARGELVGRRVEHSPGRRRRGSRGRRERSGQECAAHRPPPYRGPALERHAESQGRGGGGSPREPQALERRRLRLAGVLMPRCAADRRQ